MLQTRPSVFPLPRPLPNVIRFAALAATVSPLAGCNDPQVATRSNFVTALTPVVAGECGFVDLQRFDFAAHVDGTNIYEFSHWFPLRQPDVEALVSAQLIQPVSNSADRLAPGATQRIELTPAGAADIRTLRGHHTLCVADLSLKAIKSWTQPADSMGERISVVTLEVEPVRRRTWAASAAMRARFPNIARYDAATREATVVMVLTNTGWATRSTPPLTF